LVNAAKRLGESLRNTQDQLIRNMLAASAAFVNCVGGVNGDNPTEISGSDIDDAVRALRTADGRPFLDEIYGDNRFGSAPVRNSYLALASTQIESELNNVPGFIHASQYPNPNGPLESEYGSVRGLRFLTSSNGSVTATSSNLGADVYNVFCVAVQGYACVEQTDYSAQFIYNGPELNGPLRLNSTAGYKFGEVPVILQDSWVLNLRCTL